MASKVLYMDARAKRFMESTAIKGRQILEHSGWMDRLKPGDIVAVKTHMGEAYNVGYLRPVIIRTLVDALRERGLRPFVTDTTTMPYHPWISRTLAIDHLETAAQNGFSESTVGAPIIMADGWLGTDDVVVDLEEAGCYLNKQFVARAIADADALLSVAHFKGHPAGGFGGAIKNIGVGCASKRGKMNLHGALAGDKPLIDPAKCPGRSCDWWETCQDCCPESAIEVGPEGLKVDQEACVYCFACANLCINMAGVGAVQRFDHLPALGRRIADSALAVMKTKPDGKAYFLNYAVDVTPVCDCYGWTDTPIVNGLGVFASYDPVAVDKCCIDLMNQAPGLTNSEAEDCGCLAAGSAKLDIIKGKDIEPQVHGGVENGLGSKEYELVKVALDRSREAIKTYYPRVAATKLKPMYIRQHPLKGVDTASFGRPTEGVDHPRYPKK
ncbi:MAG TPA: DUF362 domain-containing protein [Desulfomonilaceae bacterium]|nr:DUF362 domain-containing protein [Desulfomonilaceae bacterium]